MKTLLQISQISTYMTEEIQTGSIADIETPLQILQILKTLLQISQISTYMTEEVQTGRNPIADIADIETPLQISQISQILQISQISDLYINLCD